MDMAHVAQCARCSTSLLNSNLCPDCASLKKEGKTDDECRGYAWARLRESSAKHLESLFRWHEDSKHDSGRRYGGSIAVTVTPPQTLPD